MATLDLGKIKQVWRGTYNNGTAYTVDDLVAYTDTVGGLQNTSTYIAVANTTGNAPASGGSIHASWNLVAQGVPDRLPSQSGHASKALITDGSTLSWGVAGRVVATTQFTYSTRSTLGSTSSRSPYWESTFTKTRANSKLRIHIMIPLGGSGTTYPHFGSDYIRFSTGGFTNNGSDIHGYIHNTRATSNSMGGNLIANFLYDTTGTNIATSGTVYWQIGYDSASGDSLRPAPIWNPNSSENNRSHQTVSALLIEEIA